MYLKSVENVITLCKLIGLLFLFCLPLLSILFLKTKRNDLACPVMGTFFLVEAPYPQEVKILAGKEAPSSVLINYLWRYNYSEYGIFLLCVLLDRLVRVRASVSEHAQ